jgi:hypothetical protein
MRISLALVWLSACAAGQGPASTADSASATTGLPSFAPPHPVSLLGADAGVRVSMDYLGYDAATDTVWAPGGNTGRVFVIDARTEEVRDVEGFPTQERDGRVVGTSSVTFGPRTAFIGNRADASVCAVDTSSFKRGPCVTLASNPDGLSYVASTREVWATTPRTQSLAVISVSDTRLAVKDQIKLDGLPEGYAVDARRGRFYTNLEDKDVTLAIDVTSRKVVAQWKTGCGKKGPRGLALDADRGFLFIACTDGLVAIALERDGRQASSLAVAQGVDNPDITPSLRWVFVASGGAGTLSVAGYGDDGTLTLLRRLTTVPGARVVVADKRGRAFVADSAGGRIWIAGP